MEGGRQRGGVDVGEGDTAVGGGGGVGCWASGTASICIRLSSVTRGERWRGMGAKHSRRFGRTVTKVQE